MMNEITIPLVNDFHVHLRRGAMLKHVVRYCKDYGYILAMPNTTPPIATAQDVEEYRSEIMSEYVKATGTEMVAPPLIVIKMLNSTTPQVVREAKQAGAVGIKIYPEGVTTNSADGISDMRDIYPALQAAEEEDMVVEIHGETAHDFILDRERAFLKTLQQLVGDFPKLRFVLEHITTEAAVNVIENLPDTVAATITIHHLMISLNDVLADKMPGTANEFLNPHNYCKPVAKSPIDLKSLRYIATSGSKKFFYGGDSAPHDRRKKESECGCAGVFNAPVAIPLLVELFESRGKLENIRGFTSDFGANFYKLPRIKDTVTLTKEPWIVPKSYKDENGENEVVPFYAGREIQWKIK